MDIAANGELGKDKLQESHYDLILIDIITPVMNGKQLYQWINEKYPKLVSRVIFTTGDVIGGRHPEFSEAKRPAISAQAVYPWGVNSDS